MSSQKTPFEVRAVLAYTARSASEISLEPGARFTVLDVDPRGKWFKARRPHAPGTVRPALLASHTPALQLKLTRTRAGCQLPIRAPSPHLPRRHQSRCKSRRPDKRQSR